jgi:hypothetical protein
MKLSDLTKQELYLLAVEHNILNRATMTQAELVKALDEIMKSGGITAPSSQSNSDGAYKTPAPYVPPVYNIPERYQIDTIVLLPVSPRREYVYWEVSDASVKRLKTQHGVDNPVFILKLFCICSEGKTEEIANVRVEAYGSWFFDLKSPERTLWSELGIMDTKGNYYPVLHSRKISMPSDKISQTIDEETWITVGENIENIYRLSGAGELDTATPGSIKLFQEMLKHIDKTVSSKEMIKRGEA